MNRLLRYLASGLAERDELIGVEGECVTGQACIAGLDGCGVALAVVLLSEVVPARIECCPPGLLRLFGMDCE